MHKSQTLMLLVLAYVAATWFPEPGLWARELRLPTLDGFISLGMAQVRIANLLLAVLLFSSGLSSSWGAMRNTLRTRSELLRLAAITWLLPLLGAVVAGAGLLGLGWLGWGGPVEVVFGLWLIAAMPVANSSVGWSNVMRGNVPLSLALLILSTSLSPLTSPWLIQAGSLTLGIEAGEVTSAASSGIGLATFFALWVLLPVALGAWGAGKLNARWAARVLPMARHTSLVMLLLLNYLNGTACLPNLLNEPATLAWPIVGAVALISCILGCFRLTHGLFFSEELATRRGANGAEAITASESNSGESNAGASDSGAIASGAIASGASISSDAGVGGSRPPASVMGSHDAVLLAVTMRNTGVALVYSTASLASYEWISLTIIAYTITQHLLVSLIVGPRKPDREHQSSLHRWRQLDKRDRTQDEGSTV